MITDIQFTPEALVDYNQWEKDNQKIFNKIKTLIGDIIQHPFTGLGKPEPLKYELTGYWSRRINKKHRLVYKVVGETLRITDCKEHY
jgi:toxin YoeB